MNHTNTRNNTKAGLMGNNSPQPKLARRLGLFDATMIVMGGIIGSGIFMNGAVVARQLSSPVAILGVWALGGIIALAAAFIWAELASLRPEVGGQYAYLRDAFHPLLAFLYGWVFYSKQFKRGMVMETALPPIKHFRVIRVIRLIRGWFL